jgi:hypothetical protein
MKEPPAIDRIAEGSRIVAAWNKARCGEEAHFAQNVPGLGATTKSLGVRPGRSHHTTARTAVMKAKAAQIERISTLIADVITSPPEVQMKCFGSESANSFSMSSSVKI